MKINLSNATFIIPLKIESDDRLRNIITTMCFLLSNFKTNFIVHEVDQVSKFAEEALPQIREFVGPHAVKQIKHVFEESTSPSFHRQRVLNDMIMMCETDVVVNYDCDIILPIKSYEVAYDAIIKDKADVVYPYGDGDYQIQVHADDNLVTDFLIHDFDYEHLQSKSNIYDAKYGFCQFFSRKAYIEGGMENENFVAYAPEDVERYHRFVTLGYRVVRISNVVYHLEHERTFNSWFNNPHMGENQREWNKIQQMSEDELRTYILNQDYYKERTDGQE